jgi:hypothetical protein
MNLTPFSKPEKNFQKNQFEGGISPLESFWWKPWTGYNTCNMSSDNNDMEKLHSQTTAGGVGPYHFEPTRQLMDEESDECGLDGYKSSDEEEKNFED